MLTPLPIGIQDFRKLIEQRGYDACLTYPLAAFTPADLGATGAELWRLRAITEWEVARG